MNSHVFINLVKALELEHEELRRQLELQQSRDCTMLKQHVSAGRHFENTTLSLCVFAMFRSSFRT